MFRNEGTAPLTFQPIFIERMWGGRRLESEFHKKLPPQKRIGESWEIVDRSEAQSVVAGGPLGGRTSHELWTQQREEIFGDLAGTPRFPLLIKILDAQEKLSLQVHPPENVASKLGGEPKSEFWYVAAANPDAEVFVGFREPITREMFEEKLRNGTVIDYIHKIAVGAGDAIFLPAGRVHAIGAGNLLIEIQQNSDTTYRVFDWNRVGLDGKSRELHVRQSLASINFNDFEPALVANDFSELKGARKRELTRDELFSADLIELRGSDPWPIIPGKAQIVAVVSGHLQVAHPSQPVSLSPGQFSLIPAASKGVVLKAASPATFLLIEPGRN